MFGCLCNDDSPVYAHDFWFMSLHNDLVYLICGSTLLEESNLKIDTCTGVMLCSDHTNPLTLLEQ